MGQRKKKLTTLTFDPESFELVNHYVSKLGCSRADFLRTIVNLAMESEEIMNKVGVFKLESLRDRGIIIRLPLGHYE